MNLHRARRWLRALAIMTLMAFTWQGLALAGPLHAHAPAAPPQAAADAGEGPMHDHHHAPAADEPSCSDTSSDCGTGHSCGLCAPAVADAMAIIHAPTPGGASPKVDHLHAPGQTNPPFRPPGCA